MRGRGIYPSAVGYPTVSPEVTPLTRQARGRGPFVGAVGYPTVGSQRPVNGIVQRMPGPPVLALTGSVEIPGTIVQTMPGPPMQALTGTVAASTARSVRVMYLVLEVPDPLPENLIVQMMPGPPVNALAGSVSFTGRIVQTMPGPPVIAAAGTTSNVGLITQTIPLLINALTGTNDHTVTEGALERLKRSTGGKRRRKS